MKILNLSTLLNSFKQFSWAMCTLLGTGLFATAMAQPFDQNFNGWQLFWHTIKNDARGGAPHIHFVLLMVVQILLILAAMALIFRKRVHVMLVLASSYLGFFAWQIGLNLWLFPHDLILYTLLLLFVASYCLPEGNFIEPTTFTINALSLIYVVLMVLKMP